MPQQAWNTKQERQYEHIKQQTRKRGSSTERAEEIAARTVNKNRARSGQAEQRSSTSTKDISPQRRGGIRSGNRYGPGGRTKEQLYDDARRQNIKGRSKMMKAELEKAVSRR
ncbi:MAG: plasmid stabilization protein [Pseudonocardiaceae bacterium]|nr:plasmid stabilization protein [Pseudonocardiaceae bacterium]